MLENKAYLTTNRWLLPLTVVLSVALLIGFGLWYAYAYEFAEFVHGKPQAPAGSLLHAWEVEQIEDLADWTRIACLLLSAVVSIALVVWVIGVLTGYQISEVILSREGVVLRRWGLGPWRKPIVIQRITEVGKSRSGKAVKLIGATPEGKKITRRVGMNLIGKKRWEEFKGDLQNYLAPTGETTAEASHGLT